MLKLDKVTKSFGSIQAISDISFDIDDGEFVFLVGPSGAGKTTILRMILHELTPDSGEILFDGLEYSKMKDKEVPALRQKIGVVFQDFKVIPELTVWENVEIALAVINIPKTEWQARVDRVLELTGLQNKKNLFPSQLSGGEAQRLSLARALVVNPRIILADEPTGNLDWETSEGIMELFDLISKEGKTILMATHNRQILSKMKKRTIEIIGGKVVSEVPEKEVIAKKDPKKRKIKVTLEESGVEKNEHPS